MALATAAVGSTANPAQADPITVGSAPPERRMYFITDSVGLGAFDALRGAFPSGWQTTMDGFPALFVEQMESNHVRPALTQRPGVFGDYAIVAGGYNYPYWDPARFDASIDSIIAAFEQAGVKHVFWVTLREVKQQYVTPSAWRAIQPYYWYFPTVNQHLRAALARHPNLTLIDWAAIADRPGLTYDAIHLNAFGASEYAALVSRTVQSVRGRIPDGSVTEVTVAGTGGVPGDASAVALNLAITGARAPGYLTAYPCGEQLPLAANLNYVPDRTVSAAAVVPVGANGRVCIYNSTATQLVVDVMGSFPAGSAYARVGPTRLTDTREPGQHGPLAGGEVLRVQLPEALRSARAAVLNVTAIGGSAAGFVTAYHCGDPVPGTSNLNFSAGSITPNLVVVQPDETGAVCLRPNQPADLVVDLFGGLDGPSILLPGPARATDTRSGVKPTAGSSISVATVGGAGVFLNVTATEPSAPGFLTVYPCEGGLPPTANLTYAAGETIGNFALVKPDSHGNVCVFTNASSHIVVDVLGSMTSGFDGLPVPVRAFDSR